MKSYQSFFSLEGKNAIITGGAGILGKKFCEGLCEMGANLAIYEYKNSQAEELAQHLTKKYSRKILVFSCDISNEDSVKTTVEKTIKEFNHIDILHNNAASKGRDLNDFFKPFEEFDVETWDEIMNVNLGGMFLMAQAVGPHMKSKKIRGSIIQTASIYGILAPDQRIYEGSNYMGRAINTPAIYSASKAGVLGLTKYLATYWAQDGIRVNALTPGGVESGQNDIFSKKYSARVPMGRMAQDYEMVGALLFLASEASSYITGQNIVVDGGLSAW